MWWLFPLETSFSLNHRFSLSALFIFNHERDFDYTDYHVQGRDLINKMCWAKISATTVWQTSFYILQFPIQVAERDAAPSSSQEVAPAEGFGKLYPSAQASQEQEEHSDDELDLTSDVISRKELEKGRLSRDGKYELKGADQWLNKTGKVQIVEKQTTIYYFPTYSHKFNICLLTVDSVDLLAD